MIALSISNRYRCRRARSMKSSESNENHRQWSKNKLNLKNWISANIVHESRKVQFGVNLRKESSTQITSLPIQTNISYFQWRCHTLRKGNKRPKFRPTWDSKPDDHKTQAHMAVVIEHQPKRSLILTKISSHTFCANCQWTRKNAGGPYQADVLPLL